MSLGTQSTKTNPQGADAPRRVRRWLTRGSWAIFDQGLFAGANFVLNVLLARLISPADYGVFSVSYALLLLAGTVHTAFLTEPMLVFGPGRYRDWFRPYLSSLVNWHWRLTGLFAAVFLLAGAVFLISNSDSTMGWAMMAMGFATAPILLQWLYRRACYVKLEPRYAVEAGGIYLSCILVGILVLQERNLLSAASSFLLLAGASLASAAWIHRQLGKESLSADVRTLDARDVSRVHLGYGRWAAGTAVLSWVPGNIYYLVLPLITSMEDVGGLRALMNLLMPVLHVSAALGLLLLPALVRQIRAGAEIRSLVIRIALLFLAAAVAYGLILLAAGEWLIDFLYEGKYDSLVTILLVLAVLPVASALVAVLGGVLRALERPDLVFRVYAGTLIVTMTLGLGLVLALGIYGAALGLLLSSSTTALLMAILIPRAGGASAPGPSRRLADSG
jgi:O-antigen/teichoic acid export membrane protein